MWQKERSIRTDITDRESLKDILNNHSNTDTVTQANPDGTIYQGAAYALKTLSKPYSVEKDLRPTVHGGINYEVGKNRDIIHDFTHRHGRMDASGIPQNVFAVGVDAGQGVIEKQRNHDVEDINIKEKINVKGYVGKYANRERVPTGPTDESNQYLFTFGNDKMPINIMSGTISDGYNAYVSASFRGDAIFTNIHSDTTTITNDIPMQGPFTQNWVGGHQHRHIDLNKVDASRSTTNNLDDKYSRAEAWQIMLNDYSSSGSPYDGAFGFVGADYGGPYPDQTREMAIFYRESRAKRPVNIKNIKTTTQQSAFFSLGNYKNNYEIVQTTGKKENNLYLRKNEVQTNFLPSSIASILPQTTNPMTLIGVGTGSVGNVFGVIENNLQPDGVSATYDIVNAAITASSTKTVISSRFSAPGSPEVNTLGYLDAYSKEYSVYNNLNYRNLSVRGLSSGESGSIRVDDFIGMRNGLRTHLARPTGKHGRDFLYGASRVAQFRDYSFIDLGPAAGWDAIIGNDTSGGSTQIMTFSAWIYKTADNGDMNILDFGDTDIRLFTNNDERIILKAKWNGGAGVFWNSNAGVFSLNQWTHVAVTYDANSTANNAKIYINGVSVAVTETGTAPAGSFDGISTERCSLGGWQNSFNGFHGYIDELAIWNKELSSEEIYSIYNVGREKSLEFVNFDTYSSLQLWYKLGDLDDMNEKFYDYSGNGNHSLDATSVSIVNINDSIPSLNSIHRNRSRRPKFSTTSPESPLFKNTFDNAYVSSPIPKSDFQYTWVNNTIREDFGLNSGKQRIYGYAPRDGILSSSVIIDGESGFVPAINFPSSSQIFGEQDG